MASLVSPYPGKSTMKRLLVVISIVLSAISVASASAAGLTGPGGVEHATNVVRYLEDGGGLEFEDLSGTPMHEVILTSLKVYGSLFAALFFVFLLGRHFYPKAFLVLRDSEEDATDLSRKIFGPISWMWKVFGVSDEEIFEECGMDAVSIFTGIIRSTNPNELLMIA